MNRIRWGLVVIFVAMTTLSLAQPVAANKVALDPNETNSLISPYWNSRVRRWEDVIVMYAQQRGLDPDLVAAVVWKESLGQQTVYSYAGAVGLMQVMPREAGYSWRPTAQELEDPWTNIEWGTAALTNGVRESRGDIFNALAAYNGGWAQIHLRVTRTYATEVLAHYARAVAMRCGLPREGHWVATVAAVDRGAQKVLTVLGPQRSLTRYTSRPLATHIPGTSTDGQPTTVAFSPIDGQGWENRIGVWILWDDQIVHKPVLQRPVSSALSEDDSATNARAPSESLP